MITRQNIPCDTSGNALLTAPLETKSSNTVTLTSDDSGKTILTNGNTVQQAITLPAAAAGLTFKFINLDAQGLIISPAGGDAIAFHAVTTATLATTQLYASLTLVAVDSTNWIATSIVGDWVTDTAAIYGHLFNASSLAGGTIDVSSGFGSITATGGIITELNECFTAETPVLVEEGRFMPISHLYKGDEVMSVDPFGNPKKEEIVSILSHEVKLILTINGELRCTPTHPFFTTQGWVQAGNLNTSSILLNRAGEEIPVTHIHRTEHPEGITVYNLHLGALSAKVFFVGRETVLVHNK